MKRAQPGTAGFNVEHGCQRHVDTQSLVAHPHGRLLRRPRVTLLTLRTQMGKKNKTPAPPAMTDDELLDAAIAANQEAVSRQELDLIAPGQFAEA